MLNKWKQSWLQEDNEQYKKGKRNVKLVIVRERSLDVEEMYERLDTKEGQKYIFTIVAMSNG